MKANHPLIHTALLTGMLALASASAEDASMSIDQRAPLRATLLPTVSVTADANSPDAAPKWKVDDHTALRVTLMPTVRVTPDLEQMTTSVLPSVKVTASVSALAAQDALTARKALAAMPKKSPALAQVTPAPDRASDRTATDNASAKRLGVAR